jgi:N-carbamoyl-L-amino-acid hydrolase
MTATINAQRLWDSLMQLARIGATKKGGVCRLALSELDGEARALFIGWCKEAGCTVKVDAIGNIFARRPGQDDRAPAVVTGSHIDTQPSGGKFDGNYGVLAGLEVVRTLNDLGVKTRAPVEVAVWTNEEGSRFTPGMMGSGVFVGEFALNAILQRADIDGVSVGEALRRIGYAGAEPPGGRPLGAYFEAHIEQGPVLENEHKVLGVVLGALGLRWYDVVISGQDAHAGPTPMGLRKDALVAAARIVAEVNALADRFQPDGRGTVGFMQVKCASRSIFGTPRTSRWSAWSKRCALPASAWRARNAARRASSGSPAIPPAGSTTAARARCATPRSGSASATWISSAAPATTRSTWRASAPRA